MTENPLRGSFLVAGDGGSSDIVCTRVFSDKNAFGTWQGTVGTCWLGIGLFQLAPLYGGIGLNAAHKPMWCSLASASSACNSASSGPYFEYRHDQRQTQVFLCRISVRVTFDQERLVNPVGCSLGTGRASLVRPVLAVGLNSASSVRVAHSAGEMPGPLRTENDCGPGDFSIHFFPEPLIHISPEAGRRKAEPYAIFNVPNILDFRK